MKIQSRAAFPLFLVLFGCKTPSGSQGPTGPLAVAAGEDSYYLFQEGRIELLCGDQTEGETTYPVEAGTPTAVGADPNGGWAAAAYQRGLFAVQLVEGRMLPVEGVCWTSPPTAIGVRGGLAGTVEDETIGLYRVTDGQVLWRPPASEVLADLDVSELRFVLPLSREELVVVAHHGMGPFSEPNTVVVKVDRRSGRAEVPRSQQIPVLHVLAACASDGKDIFLVGQHDEERLVPGAIPPRQLVPSLVIVRVDPETLSVREILRQERAEEVRIRQMAVGYGLLALCFEGGGLEVYRFGEGGAVRAYANRYKSEVNAACLDERHVVVSTIDQSRIQAIP